MNKQDRWFLWCLLFNCFLAGAGPASGADTVYEPSLPNRNLTPGALNPAVTQENIGETICVRGWTAQVRPPKWLTDEMKRQSIRQYGYADRRLWLYEGDHLIPLCLGGASTDARNFWAEPWRPADGWGAREKDELEAELCREVCVGRLGLREAQASITHNWISAYRRFVGQ